MNNDPLPQPQPVVNPYLQPVLVKTRSYSFVLYIVLGLVVLLAIGLFAWVFLTLK